MTTKPRALRFGGILFFEITALFLLATGAGHNALGFLLKKPLAEHPYGAEIFWQSAEVAALCLPALIALTLLALLDALGRLSICDTAHQLWHHLDILPLRKTRIAALCVFCAFVIVTAWQCDDAYHSHRMSFNLANGDGFVYNIGERVNAATCPLWSLLIAGAYKLTGQMYLSSLFLCVAFSTAACGILFWRFCTSARHVVLALALLLCSRSFISYTTSGLENALLFFLFALLLWVFYGSKRYSSRHTFLASLVCGLIMTARMDNALLLAPILLFILFRQKREGTIAGFFRALGPCALGMLPFVAWEVFATIYYGFPFPNTAYSKIGAGYPAGGYFVRGLWYFVNAAYCDALLLIAPCVLGYISRKTKHETARPLIVLIAFGLYCLYLLKIGGDFMSGRHLTVPFFVCMCAIFSSLSAAEPHTVSTGAIASARDFFTRRREWLAHTKPVLAKCALLFLFLQINLGLISGVHNWISPVKLFFMRKGGFDVNALVVPHDERAEWGRLASLRAYIREKILVPEDGPKLRGMLDNDSSFYDKAKKIPAEYTWYLWYVGPLHDIQNEQTNGDITRLAGGIARYAFARSKYVNDTIGLGDPLLARLKARKTSEWLVGHLHRNIPAGYRASVQTGINQVKDPHLSKYLDIIWEITRGKDLFCPSRLEKIWKINTGGYDSLLRAFHLRQQETEMPFKDYFPKEFSGVRSAAPAK